MRINEKLKFTGSVTILKWNAQGKLVAERHIPNLVVTAGKSFIASRMVGVADAVMSHMALGSITIAPLAADTALGTELGRVALTSGTASTTTISYTATFPAGTATGTITEAGIFNASSAGTMLCRTTFSAVTKAAGDELAVSWDITIS